MMVVQEVLEEGEGVEVVLKTVLEEMGVTDSPEVVEAQLSKVTVLEEMVVMELVVQVSQKQVQEKMLELVATQ